MTTENNNNIINIGQARANVLFGRDYNAVSGIANPVYEWTTPVKLTDPDSAPSSTGSGITWSPGSEYISVSFSNAPRIATYQLNGTNLIRVSQPNSTSVTNGIGIDWSACGRFLGRCGNGGMEVYEANGSAFSRLPNPATMPGGYGHGISWTKNSQYLAISHIGAAPYVDIYKRSGTTLTRIGDVVSAPLAQSVSCQWSPDDKYLALGLLQSPRLVTYKRTGDVLVRITDPESAGWSDGRSVEWSPDGKYLAVGHSNSGGRTLDIYKFLSNETFQWLLSTPDSQPQNAVYGISWSRCGRYIAAAHYTTPFLSIFKWENEKATRLPNVSDLPPGDCLGVKFNNDTSMVAVYSTSSPNLVVYKTTGTMIEHGTLRR